MSAPSVLFLFDIDGTLLRGAGLQHREAIIEGVRRATGVITCFDGVDTAGRLDFDLIAGLLTKAGVEYENVSALIDLTAASSCDSFIKGDGGDLSHCILPGITKFLERAASLKMLLGVVSGNLQAIGLKKLERAGLRHHFSVCAFSEKGHTRAELARLAADEARDMYGIDEWTPVFLVGDHVNDIEAARANGFYSVAVATGVISLDRLKNCDPTIALTNLTETGPAELVELCRR